MTLDKAIEILDYADTNSIVLGIPRLKDALKLGIEALKAIPHYRRIVYPDQRFLLPGETKD